MPRSAHEILKDLTESFPEFNNQDAEVNGGDLITFIAQNWDDIRAALGLPGNKPVYVHAQSFREGWQGSYIAGPYPDFDPKWMWGEDLIFRVTPGARPVLAADEMIQHAGGMSERLYVKLVARVKEVVAANPVMKAQWPDFDVEMAAVRKVIDAAAFARPRAVAPTNKSEGAAVIKPVKFCFASTYAGGLNGNFLYGPMAEFTSRWSDTDIVAFSVIEGEKPRLAVEQILPHVAKMPKSLFIELEKALETMELAKARGEDALPDFDRNLKDLAAVVDAAPWTMHPDYGCVRADEVEALDAQAGGMKP